MGNMLLAAGDWGFLVPLVFFVVWALNQIISAMRTTQPQRPKPVRRLGEVVERPPRPQQKPAPPAPASPQSQLNSEI
jgi:hypothetical protein